MPTPWSAHIHITSQDGAFMVKLRDTLNVALAASAG